ncbi:hypothetical protein ABVK25_000672 [Lepraria finkii]|uniref:Uncharacterized protein n=1 Tax=Lepraria finkii TaxID=1340010 RepID=A0ABR4BNK2_9LECA
MGNILPQSFGAMLLHLLLPAVERSIPDKICEIQSGLTNNLPAPAAEAQLISYRHGLTFQLVSLDLDCCPNISFHTATSHPEKASPVQQDLLFERGVAWEVLVLYEKLSCLTLR